MIPRPPAPGGTFVFVDGFNFYDELERAFGRNARPHHLNAFNLPGLVRLLCEREGLPPADSIQIFIGLLTEGVAHPQAHGFWNYKIKEMRTQKDQGLKVRTRANVVVPKFRCPDCDSTEATCSNNHTISGPKSVEKGVDVAMAMAASEAAFVRGARNLIFFTRDKDALPIVQKLREHFTATREQYLFLNAYPQPVDPAVKVKPLSHMFALPFSYDEFGRSVG